MIVALSVDVSVASAGVASSGGCLLGSGRGPCGRFFFLLLISWVDEHESLDCLCEQSLLFITVTERNIV